MIHVTAPGKLLLFGEHAVVYNRPCLVTAVNQRLSVKVEKTDDDNVMISSPQTKDTRFVDATLKYASEVLGMKVSGFHISTESPFSGMFGFGSSSAVTVALLHALSVFSKTPLDTRTLFTHAYKIIYSVQGVGSGFDVAAACFGGTLYFVTGGRVIEPLAFKNGLPLIVGYSGMKSNTVEIIQQVAKKREQNFHTVERIFDAIEKVVNEAKESLTQSDWKTAGKLMNVNQEYLRDLGVSSEKLETLISAARQAGAYGAKLSGAGGGDCMIALVSDEQRENVKAAITKAGGVVVDVLPNSFGVRIETSDDQTEEFVVVDEKDIVIDYKSRSECHHDKSHIHRGIGLFIFDDHGRVLLQKRSLSKDTNPGLWTDSVGGHVLRGETYEQAMRRETKEELGIDISFQFHSKFIFSYPYETEMEALFTATHNGPFYPDATEVETVAFVSKDELQEKMKTDEIQLTGFAQEALKRIGFLQ